MADFRQILLYLLLILTTKSVYGTDNASDTNDDKEELIETETRDGKLEIVKKIKKINEDGSYTIGYEADDGSFKIESRDVLGQIKGTYGFLDENGNVKRVSYSTTNASEIVSTPLPTASVVQRIPSKYKTTTKRPGYIFSSSFPTTQSAQTTQNSVVQNITKRRTTLSATSSTTTARPNYSSVVNISRTTNKPNYVTYTSAPPRVLLQGRPSNVVPDSQASRSEGQLVRPEVVTIKPTELPAYKTLTLKRLEDEKPVHEEYDTQIRGSILRRQLIPGSNNFNAREEVYRLQQSLGDDNMDVYSNSMTTGHPKPPLFTTTSRPRLSSTPGQAPQYPIYFQRAPVQEIEISREHFQETSTPQPVPIQSTSVPVPVAQIPPNRPENHDQLLAVRQQSQREGYFVPLHHLQGRLIPVEQYRPEEDPRPYQYHQENNPPSTRVVEIEQQKAIVRKLPPPPLRPIPVQVDENGYIRELPRQVSTPYPLPVPVTPGPIQINPEHLSRYVESDLDNEIDHIQPPVSTRDFHKLLQQLITRQSRLEKINLLTNQPEIYMQMQQRFRPVYAQPEPYLVQRIPNDQQARPVQLIQDVLPQQQQQRKYFNSEQYQQQQQQQQNLYADQYNQQSYRANRRVARLQPARAQQNRLEDEEEYLPPNVREMLLLRMLQLAINPTLPVDEDDIEMVSLPPKKKPVRNVEILGEESEPIMRRAGRIKRFKGSVEDY